MIGVIVLVATIVASAIFGTILAIADIEDDEE